MLTVWIPRDQPTTYEHEMIVNNSPKKLVYQARMHAGRLVVDLAPGFFQLLLGSGNGLLWQKTNPRAVEWLGTLSGTNTYLGSPFPDEHNPPATQVAPAVAALVSVKLRAPAGVGSYSVRGIESKVGKDGLIEVDGHVADELRPHGFVPV
jgi:hypothetical protein